MLVLQQLMWAIVTQRFETVVETCLLENWKEALAVVLTYAAGDDFNNLCGQSDYSLCLMSHTSVFVTFTFLICREYYFTIVSLLNRSVQSADCSHV